MSSSRSGKRKRCNEIKQNLVEDMYDLVNTSATFTEEVVAAKEDFQSFFKAMADRHSELLSQAIGINEKYGSIIELIKGKKKPRTGSTSASVTNLPTLYSMDTRKFLDDTHTSMTNHATQLNIVVGEMITDFQKHVEEWTKKLEDLKEQTEEMMEQKRELDRDVQQYKADAYN